MDAGTRVKITAPMMGTITEDEPYRFTDYIAGEGDTGEIVAPTYTLPTDWILVKLDHKHDDGRELFAPVHPGCVEVES